MPMPKFKYKDSSIQNDTDLDQALAQDAKKESKVVKPGNYGVTIKAVKDNGQSDKDRTWTKLGLELEIAGGNTIKSTVLIPSESIFFGPKQSKFLFTKAQKFCAALGEDLKISTWVPVLTKLFAKPEKLVGQSLNIDVGYPNAYPEWGGKTDNGVQFKLRLKDGSLEQENGQPKLFGAPTSKEAVDSIKNYCASKGILFDAFPQVMEFNPANSAPEAEVGW